ncbi:hypothetical protein XENORESO_014117, partial [Xenotaenia resolanae]
ANLNLFFFLGEDLCLLGTGDPKEEGDHTRKGPSEETSTNLVLFCVMKQGNTYNMQDAYPPEPILDTPGLDHRLSTSVTSSTSGSQFAALISLRNFKKRSSTALLCFGVLEASV